MNPNSVCRTVFNRPFNRPILLGQFVTKLGTTGFGLARAQRALRCSKRGTRRTASGKKEQTISREPLRGRLRCAHRPRLNCAAGSAGFKGWSAHCGKHGKAPSGRMRPTVRWAAIYNAR